MIDATYENLSPLEQRECLISATQFFKNEDKLKQKLFQKYQAMLCNMVTFLNNSKDIEQDLIIIENFLNKNFKNNSLKIALYELLIYDIMEL